MTERVRRKRQFPPALTLEPQLQVPQHRTIDSGLNEARALLGDKAAEFLPEDRIVTGLYRETFQSPAFQRAGYSQMPERYGDHDRSLTAITFADGSQTFLVVGRVSSGRPTEVGHAAEEGLDLRHSQAVIYEFDGESTIREIQPTGEAESYTGENGRPEVLLPWIRRSLGTLVGHEDFVAAGEGIK